MCSVSQQKTSKSFGFQTKMTPFCVRQWNHLSVMVVKVTIKDHQLKQPLQFVRVSILILLSLFANTCISHVLLK